MHEASNNGLDIPNPEGSILNKTGKTVSERTFHELFLLSAFIFVVSALLLQFLMNLQTAIFLRHYSISFTYSLFDCNFTSVNGARWTPTRIYTVYGTGVLVFFLTGTVLLWVRVKNWKLKLTLTWLSFLMMHLLPLNMISGIYFYNGFGITYSWLFQNVVLRLLIALPVMLIAIYFRPYWIFRFLKTAFSRACLDDEIYRKEYLKYCFIFPWFAGAGIICAFALTHLIWPWVVFIFGLGAVVLPVFSKTIPTQQIIIYKSNKKILPIRNTLLYFITITLLCVIWLLSIIKIYY